MSAYGDINMIWIDDRECGSNSCNNAYHAGIRSPYLVDRLATSKGLQLTDGASFQKNIAILLCSQKGTTPGIPLPNGMLANVALDAITLPLIADFGFLFIGAVDAQGQVAFAGVPSNFAKLLGGPVYVGGVLLDSSFRWTGVIDPIMIK